MKGRRDHIRGRYPFAVDGWTMDFDRRALPLSNRRDTALALAEAGWDLGHLKCEFNVVVEATDLKAYGLSDADLRKLAARVLMSRWPLLFGGIDGGIKEVESEYGVTLTGADFDPEVMTVDQRRGICNALAARGEGVEALAAHFGVSRKAGA